MHVSPGGQPPRHKGNSPPHGSNGLVVVVVGWVVDVDVVVGGVVRLVVVSGTVAVVVVVDVDVVRGVVLLVVGVGTGLLVHLARQAGWDAAGVDICAEAAARTAREFGVAIAVGA